MSRGPFFSVIVVSYNAGEKLGSTISCILAQSCRDVEIIVKDGGSQDGSYEKLLEELGGAESVRDGMRIRLYCEEDRGIYDAMNTAVGMAQGEYLYFLNCGDRLHGEDVLELVKEKIRAGSGVPAIWYGDVLEESSGQIVLANPDMNHFAMYRYLPCHQACFYHRELVAERGFDVNYRVRADYEHFLWCVIDKEVPACPLYLVIADYEGGGYSETKMGLKRSAEEHREITKRYFTNGERFLYRLYLIVTLQPLRKKLAQSPLTAGLYDKVKNTIYRMRQARR